MKRVVTESRYDFRGGRNTAISTDLLNPNELVDCTNTRLSTVYGGFSKRTGCQRIHQTALGASIDGLTQWDGPNGKQVVAIANGKLYYRDGFDYTVAFSSKTPTATVKSTANGTDPKFAWTDTCGSDDGICSLSRTTNGTSTNTGGLTVKLGDPNQTEGSNVDASDDVYVVDSFSVKADGTGTSGIYLLLTTSVQFQVSTDSGGTWVNVGSAYQVTASVGVVNTTTYNNQAFTVSGSPTHVWFRIVLTVTTNGNWSGTATGTVTMKNGSSRSAFSWNTAGGGFSGPVFFMPFRDPAANAKLKLYFSSGGHLWVWDGTTTLTQLDPTNGAPAANALIAYHTRAFATQTSTPKTLFWSKIGDPTTWTPLTKADGGFAVTDFLTGNALVSFEVIGSSLLMGTKDSVMRFTGHASDDIVISQDTEGITTDVGVVGPYAIKRFENVCAFLSERGPYAATETYADPMGEQLNPDWFSLDTVNLGTSAIEYHRGRKELWFLVPRTSDGGSNKTLFIQSVRLQSWQGPWAYSFGMTSLCKYTDISGIPNILSGGTDGFIRIMDVQTTSSTTTVLDDVLFDGTGGNAVTMTVEFPVLHFGSPGLKKALKWLLLQGDLPASSSPVIKIAFDSSGFTSFPFVAVDTAEEDYRVDIAGNNSQGFRCRMQFVDASDQMVTVNGWTLVAWDYMRTS